MIRILWTGVLAAVLAVPVLAMGRKTPKTQSGGGPMEATKNFAADVTPNEWRGSHSAETGPSARIVESGAEWDRLWRDAVNQKAPAVNFNKYFAAAVFLGAQPTGGYGVEFIEPLSNGQELVLRYRILRPKGMVTQAFTQPYAIKLYKKGGLKASLSEDKG
ncbi:MAG: protease complex subunit PrcB family protein [Elusimicrobia bacterium]|nr:protease complex subunit PrcB family protein [Elusimicrobiota bacterium]